MTTWLIASILISLLHAIIPNHWLPVMAIARKQGWSLGETTRIMGIAGTAHVCSTVLIGGLLALIGSELASQLESFTRIIGPSLLILMGLYFLHQHYVHHHFHLDSKNLEKKNKTALILALVTAMFLSPCMEIETYFLLAGSKGWSYLLLIAALYAGITLTGMLIWIRIVYTTVLKLNWHRWEHNAGMITGLVLILSGITSFFI